MSASSDYLSVLSQLSQAKANTESEAARQNGQVWGSTIANIGQMVAQIPQQRAQLAEIKNRAALTELEKQREQRQADAEQRAQQGEAQANQLFASLKRNDDGTFDTSDLMQKFSANNVPPPIQEKFITSIENLNKVSSSLKQSQIDHSARLAHYLLGLHDQDEEITPDAVQFGLAGAKAIGLANEGDQKNVTQLLSQGADPKKILKSLEQQGTEYKPKYVSQPADAGVLETTTGTVTTPAGGKKPKTKAELAQDAANPESPTAEASAAALKLMGGETVSSAAQDEKYRQIQAKPPQARTADERAWAAAYEKQKTLGVDTSASLASQRQATAIAAQTAQQARAQGFQESQVGRKELTDKVEQPYQTAQSGVDTLRETIQAAKDGNVVAGQLQSLLTTMATLKAEGFNRINTAEINATGDAGSMFQRIEGWFSHATAGQPIPASVQKDMSSFADILEKAAYKKYQSGFQTTTKRYGLTDETPLPPPQSATPAKPAPTKANPFR